MQQKRKKKITPSVKKNVSNCKYKIVPQNYIKRTFKNLIIKAMLIEYGY